MPNGKGVSRAKRGSLAPPYCELCGDSRFVSRHRILPRKRGGVYTEGNVIGLCPSCHAQADRDFWPAKALCDVIHVRIEEEHMEEDVIPIGEALASDWYLPNTNGGFCMCGCGAKTPIATKTMKTYGIVRGFPRRFINGGHSMAAKANIIRQKEHRFCRVCELEKHRDEFYRNLLICRGCENERKMEWAKQKGRDTEFYRERNLKTKYGMSIEDYETMLAAQGGGCATCGSAEVEVHSRSEGKFRSLPVDHDHGTGMVRGILCSRCNKAIGLLDDDPDLVVRIASYLYDAEDRDFVDEEAKLFRARLERDGA